MKIGKFDLIDIDCIDQSVETNDTLFLVYRFILILPISSIYIAIHLFIQIHATS